MQIFARITKVDEATGTVYGRAVQEVPDRSSEIFDYESSKPNFEKWSTDMAKATDGKSVGNVRAMHGKVAAGKLTEITFEDAEKAIDVRAEIVDPIEREKCMKGIYSGFSIGGRYAKKWADESDASLTRYTADPTEISLVDLPCVPTAQFTVVKADGSTEMRKFETTTDAESLAKWATSLTDDEAAAVVEKIARRKDVTPKEGEDKYGAVEFADPANKKYPIDTPEHIRAAWSYIHMPKNSEKYSASDAAAIKAKITAAWKEHISKDGPPEAEKMTDQTGDDGLEKAGRKHTKKTREARAMIAHHLDEAKKHLDLMAADDPANDPDGDDDDDATEKLAKAADSLAKVTKQRDDLAADLAKIHSEVKRLSELPAPAKGAVTAVEKTMGLPTGAAHEDKPVLKADGSIDHQATALALMKSAYSQRRTVQL